MSSSAPASQDEQQQACTPPVNQEKKESQLPPPVLKSWLNGSSSQLKRKQQDTEAASPTLYVKRTKEERLQSRPSFAPTATLDMFHFTAFYYVSPDAEKGNFFELENYLHKDTPLRLYRNAMVTLCEKLPDAFKEAQRMEGTDEVPHDTLTEIGVINEFKNTRVILSVYNNRGAAHVWLRLFAKDEKDEIIPSTYAVKFSLADSIDQLKQFVIKHK